MPSPSIREQIAEALRDFLRSLGRADETFDDETNLLDDLSLSSDQGVDFVIDLSERLRFRLPEDFNPLVNEEKQRGMRFGELVERVTRFMQPLSEGGTK